MDSAKDYDGIILGAGHNGLILAAYLARAGLRVVCIDRAAVAGGGLRTVEDPQHAGFFHNPHSFFHRAVDRMPWYRDLDLARRGAKYLEPALNVAVVFEDGRVLEWWDDLEKTIRSLAAFSQRDADQLRRWRDAFVPIVEKILVPESQAPPLPFERREALLARSPEGRLLLEVSRQSPLEFVRREFEHPAVQGALLFFNGLREVDLRCPGFGHHIAALLASPARAQLCVGGSRRLAEALVSAVEEAGGAILLDTPLRKICTENGRVTGVETAAGDRLRARRFVASSLNPQQTFLELLDESALPAAWRDKAAAFRYNLLAPLFGIYLCLDEPPRYRAAETHPELNDALMVVLGVEGVATFDEIVRQHEKGAIPPTAMWGCCPTRFDATQAPAGKHTAFMWEKLPYRLGGDASRWDQVKAEHGRRMLDVWKRYAPNLEQAVIGAWEQTPLDTERALPNMREGDLLVGAFTHGQIGFHRPFPGAGHYRGCLAGLYLCGSSCHPGGNVTGLPGYNCAQVVLADLGERAEWMPPPIEERLGLG